MLKLSNKIYLDESKIEGAGRGIFAAEDISFGDVIEICPVVVVPEDQAPLLKDSELYNYYFLWDGGAGIAMGFGSLYNHSYKPNATYKKRIDDQLLDFIAIKDINKDEEITVNYNYGDPHDMSPLWIKSIKPPQS